MPDDSPTLAFDLTERPWIPVQRLDGAEVELSLRDVLRRAPELRRVVGDLPTQEFALLRLLLAILHDAVGGPADSEEWWRLWEGGLPVERITEYLAAHRERFDLLHPATPFFQVADLRTEKDEIFALDRLVADVPNGALFFTMRARGVSRLDFAEAARWVVHAHAYDPSGIKSGPVGDPRVKNGKNYPQGPAWAGNLGGILVEGADLRETLLLNLIAADTEHLRHDSADRPAWRFDPPGAAPVDGVERELRPYGPRDLYTWQSRRLRLFHDAEGVYGVLLSYGDPLAPRNMHSVEPMTAWRRSPAQEKRHGESLVYLPREHDPARSAWRGLAALVEGDPSPAPQRQEAAETLRPRVLDWVARLTVEGVLDEDHLIRARTVGAVYGTQQSVIDELVDDRVTMAVVLLHERRRELAQTAIDAVGEADAAVRALGDLAADLAQAAGHDTAGPRVAARERGFDALDGPFRAWLATLTSQADAAERHAAWRDTAARTVRGVAAELIGNAGQAAWVGRVITTGSGELWLNAAHAELRFQRRLREELPESTPENTTGASA